MSIFIFFALAIFTIATTNTTKWKLLNSLLTLALAVAGVGFAHALLLWTGITGFHWQNVGGLALLASTGMLGVVLCGIGNRYRSDKEAAKRPLIPIQVITDNELKPPDDLTTFGQ